MDRIPLSHSSSSVDTRLSDGILRSVTADSSLQDSFTKNSGSPVKPLDLGTIAGALLQKSGIKTRWEFSTGKKLSVISNPEPYGKGVLLFNDSQNLYALDSITGKKLWEHFTDMWTSSNPIKGPDGSVIFPSGRYAESLCSRDLLTGEKRWDRDLPKNTTNAVANSDGILFMGSNRDTLYAIDGKTGDTLWTVPTKNYMDVTGTSKDQVFFRHGEALVSLDAHHGDLKWEYPIKNSVGALFSVTPQGDIFIGKDNRECILVDGATGKEKWRGSFEGYITGEPIYTKDGSIIFSSKDGSVYSLNGATGEKAWSFKTRDSLCSRPTLSRDEKLYTADYQGRVYALDAMTGELQWEAQPECGQASAPPLVTPDGTLFVGYTSGTGHSSYFNRFVAIDARDGHTTRKFEAPGEAYRNQPHVVQSGKAFDFCGEVVLGSSDRDEKDPYVVFAGTGDGKVVALSPLQISPENAMEDAGHTDEEKIMIEDGTVIIDGIRLNIQGFRFCLRNTPF